MANEERVELLLRSVDEWNAWREAKPYETPDLRKARLREADLREANLMAANLDEADLYRADLSSADLRKATLREADLRRADLSGADLRRAILYGADLTGADLRRADLSGADLSVAGLGFAKLAEADFCFAFFGYTKLNWCVGISRARHLDQVNHSNQSSLDFGNNFHETAALPEVFLRGCGVPEALIEYLPSFSTEAIKFYSCFISYNHDDESFARRLHDQLQARGIRCWLDKHQVRGGDKLMDAVDQGIRLWDKVILCCSKSSLNSWWVSNEVEAAFEKERKLQEQTGNPALALVPLDLDGHLLKQEGGVAAQVRTRKAINLVGWEDNTVFECGFKEIVDALHTERPPPPPRKLGEA
ncbi:MAG: toll/interleukin-1 receptor domain-containing protein [Pseudomonadota bacterium]